MVDENANMTGNYRSPDIICSPANAVDVINLNQLPTFEGIEYNISKLTYQGLNNKNRPSYLPVEIATQKKNSAFE